MKNKSLIATLIMITSLVFLSLFFEKDNEQLALKQKPVVKIGILQLVTHEALDQIEKGIEDELQKKTKFSSKTANHTNEC